MCITDESTGRRLIRPFWLAAWQNTTHALILLWFLAQSTLVAADTTANDPTYCPLPLSTGAPVCAEGASPGSSTAPANTQRFIGNPIDVVSGNKYQREIDFQSFASDLAFVRHYNSALGDHNLGLGPGWRHSYHVVLSRISDLQLRIVQSDGRAIDFFYETGTDAPSIYKANLESDGLIHLSDKALWILPDGRILRFHGSYLVAIDFGEERGESVLFYKNERLETITDPFGQTLRLNYVSASESLPQYGTQERWRPPGAVASLELPDGSLVRYEYDEQSRLDTIVYPDNSRSYYQHEDEVWPTHLTRRRSTVDDRDTQWSYDEHGRANGWQESEQSNGLTIERNISLDANVENGQARVTYLDGWQKQFNWEQARNSEGSPSAPLLLQCEGCSVQTDDSTPSEASADSGASTDSMEEDHHDDSFASRLKFSAKPEIDGRDGGPSDDNSKALRWRVLVDIDRQRAEALVTVDRLGEIRDLQLGSTRLKELANQVLEGEAADCSAAEIPGSASGVAAIRLMDLTNGASPCGDDFFHLLKLSNALEDSGTQPGHGARSDRSSLTDTEGQAAKDLASENRDIPLQFRIIPPRRPRVDPFCKLPHSKTCDELREDRDMAALSACVYEGGSGSCPRGIHRVTPETVGLNSADFDSNGFHAELFYDPVRDRYTLAFRGTDGDGDDWSANLRQGNGFWARQYELASALAIRVNRALPGRDLNFTGHSLGGGLATIASLRAEREATVFNAAALHPETVDRFFVQREYAAADQYIDHIHTRSDPLSDLQEFGDFIDVFDLLGTREVPGMNTQIPNPDDHWMREQRREHGIVNGNKLILHHSMAAVLHSLDTLLERHCSDNRWQRL